VSNTELVPRPEGTMVKIARWLLAEVGPGSIFTKADLRDAFPGVQQVDRRMRDLRPFGWVIATNREDAALAPHELRFVSPGQPVWESRKRDADAEASPKERRKALLEAGYMCGLCGICAGQIFAVKPFQAAVVSAYRSGDEFVVMCQRCASGASEEVLTAERALALRLFETLSEPDRIQFRDWALNGRRPTSVELAWSAASRSPSLVASLAGFKQTGSHSAIDGEQGDHIGR
jgi:hypothetical protein